MVAVPFEDLVGAPGESRERGFHQAEKIAQAQCGPACRQRQRLVDLGRVAMPAAVEAEVLAALRLQPVLAELHAARQAGPVRAVHHQDFRFPESEPQRGLIARFGRLVKGNVIVGHCCHGSWFDWVP
ncbi:hypothetical protein D3C83_29440 [compost metagenome]